MDHGPLAMHSEGSGDDMECNSHLAPPKTVSKTPFRLLGACVVVGIMGLAGINHFGLPTQISTQAQPQQPLSPLMRYSTLMEKFGSHVLSGIHDPSKMSKMSWTRYNTFIKSFTARMLAANKLFRGKNEFIFKPEGVEFASKMKIKVALKPQSPKGARKFKIIAIAKETKQNELKETLCNMLNCKEKRSEIIVQAVGKNTVEVSMPFGPPGSAGEAKKAEGEFEEGLKTDGNELSVELDVGTTLEKLHEDQEVNIIKALNGVHLKISWAMAKGLVEGMVDMEEEALGQEEPEDLKPGNLLQKIAVVNTNTEIEYDADANFEGDVPTVAMLATILARKIDRMPDHIKENLVKVPDSCAGISKIFIPGGMAPFEIEATFQNFKPINLVALIIKQLEELKEK